MQNFCVSDYWLSFLLFAKREWNVKHYSGLNSSIHPYHDQRFAGSIINFELITETLYCHYTTKKFCEKTCTTMLQNSDTY